MPKERQGDEAHQAHEKITTTSRQAIDAAVMS